MGSKRKGGSSADRTRAIETARGLLASGRPAEAEALLRRGIPSPSKDAEALRLRGWIAEQNNQPAEMKSLAEKSLRIESHPEGHLILAQYHLRNDQSDAAMSAAKTALEVDPSHRATRMMLAAIFLERGRIDDAAEVIVPLQTDRPTEEGEGRRLGYTEANILSRRGEHQAAIDHLESTVLADRSMHAERKAALALKAKILDELGRHEEAFTVAETFNAMERIPFDPHRFGREIDGIINQFDRETLARFPIGFDDELPVFVTGMPRSGTSLVDRIIDAHPLAGGVGEFTGIEQFAARLQAATDPRLPVPECFGGMQSPQWKAEGERYVERLRRLMPDAERVVNKSLMNANLLGLIARLLPGSRVIHVLRDPRDVAISCMMGEFRPSAMPWTTKIDWVASVWDASRRLMDHWEKVLDLPILEVRYERLVTDPATEFPRIIEFLGLPWDDACLEFHATGRPLRTLSQDQVCRPLYTTSVGRHARYADSIADVDWPVLDA
ncbi:MAG: sulfotransferase [Phycisphaerales bacterium]|nr:sulfotransferase [Phycisphaerales bacterium]